jgi:hypothetical protein
MAADKPYDKAVRVVSTALAILFLVGAGYLFVQGTRSTSDVTKDPAGSLPSIEKLSEPPPAEPSPPPDGSTVDCGGTPKIASFSSKPSATSPGGTVTLSWSVSNANKVSISAVGDVSLSGSREVTVNEKTKYTLTASCGTGKTNTATKTISVDATIITGLTVSSDTTKSYSGSCPVTITFTATITVAAPTTVTYEWWRDGVSSGGTQSLGFSESSSKSVTHTWEMTSSGTHAIKFKALSPNDKAQGLEFSVTCQ